MIDSLFFQLIYCIINHFSSIWYNECAAKNSGRPCGDCLINLAKAYVQAGNHLRAAETYQIVQQMQPHQRYETSICYHYSLAGRSKLSHKWAEIAYKKSANSTTAFNLALDFRSTDEAMYQRLMEESLQRDPDGYCALLVYGQFLKQKNSERGQEMIKKAYEIMLEAFNSGLLPKPDYYRLINAAKIMGDQATVNRVEQEQRNQSQQNTDYSQENLLNRVGALPDNSTKKVKSGS